MEIKLIIHKEVRRKELQDIVNIKSVAWPFSLEQQLQWIEENLKQTDVHVLLVSDKMNVAYLNLINIQIKIDDSIKSVYGVGNVCVLEKGRGWGKEIVKQANDYLLQSDKIGLLFCKSSLVDFYKINNWVLIGKKKISLSFNSDTIKTMSFNLHRDFNHIEYLGKPI